MVVYAIFNNLYAPNLLYELTATIVLPMNSYLNPIFNSILYKYVFLRWYNFSTKAIPLKTILFLKTENFVLYLVPNFQFLNPFQDAAHLV